MQASLNEGDLLEIAVEAPFRKPLTYKFDQAILPLKRGQRVNVPLGKGSRLAKGTVLGPSILEREPDFEIKTVQSLDEEFPILTETYLGWLEWIAKYYLYPIGLVIESVFPPLEKKNQSPLL